MVYKVIIQVTGVNSYRTENYGSTSSVNSQNSGEIPIKTRPKRHVDDGTCKFYFYFFISVFCFFHFFIFFRSRIKNN
jgi:hypothetical protein